MLKRFFISTIACCSQIAAHAQIDARQPQALQSGNQMLSTTPLLFTENKGQAVDDKGLSRPDILLLRPTAARKYIPQLPAFIISFPKRINPEGYQRDERMARDHNLQASLRSQIKRSTHRFTLSLQGSNPHPRILKEGMSAYTENLGKTVTIALYNSLGQCVHTITWLPAGLHFSKEILLANTIANGLYQLRIGVEGMQAARAVMIQR